MRGKDPSQSQCREGRRQSGLSKAAIAIRGPCRSGPLETSPSASLKARTLSNQKATREHSRYFGKMPGNDHVKKKLQ